MPTGRFEGGRATNQDSGKNRRVDFLGVLVNQFVSRQFGVFQPSPDRTWTPPTFGDSSEGLPPSASISAASMADFDQSKLFFCWPFWSAEIFGLRPGLRRSAFTASRCLRWDVGGDKPNPVVSNAADSTIDFGDDSRPLIVPGTRYGLRSIEDG